MVDHLLGARRKLERGKVRRVEERLHGLVQDHTELIAHLLVRVRNRSKRLVQELQITRDARVRSVRLGAQREAARLWHRRHGLGRTINAQSARRHDAVLSRARCRSSLRASPNEDARVSSKRMARIVSEIHCRRRGSMSFCRPGGGERFGSRSASVLSVGRIRPRRRTVASVRASTQSATASGVASSRTGSRKVRRYVASASSSVAGLRTGQGTVRACV